VVVASDTSKAYGINVQIKTHDGKYLLYAHLSSKSVSVGQSVTVGQKVGAVGSTGNSSGPHLHFEVRTAPSFGAGNFLNPASWLLSHGVSV
jgi:murein DD-endopeptidase MepM/ murein hydrolase activator NlpD